MYLFGLYASFCLFSPSHPRIARNTEEKGRILLGNLSPLMRYHKQIVLGSRRRRKLSAAACLGVLRFPRLRFFLRGSDIVFLWEHNSLICWANTTIFWKRFSDEKVFSFGYVCVFVFFLSLSPRFSFGRRRIKLFFWRKFLATGKNCLRPSTPPLKIWGEDGGGQTVAKSLPFTPGSAKTSGYTSLPPMVRFCLHSKKKKNQTELRKIFLPLFLCIF